MSGLKEQIATLEQRLKLAAEAKDELDKQFQAYKVEVADKGKNASPAKFEAAFAEFKKDDALIGHALKLAQRAIEEAEASRSLPRGTGYPSLEEAYGTTLNSNLWNKKR